MIKHLFLILLLLINIPCYAYLTGGIEHRVYVAHHRVYRPKVTLYYLRAKRDYHGSGRLVGHVKGTGLCGQLKSTRGYLGCVFNPLNGDIDYVFPGSDLHKLSVQEGDKIIMLNGAYFRPCIMPNVVIYPSNATVYLLIARNGKMINLKVKLSDPNAMPGFVEMQSQPGDTQYACQHESRK